METKSTGDIIYSSHEIISSNLSLFNMWLIVYDIWEQDYRETWKWVKTVCLFHDLQPISIVNYLVTFSLQ